MEEPDPAFGIGDVARHLVPEKEDVGGLVSEECRFRHDQDDKSHHPGADSGSGGQGKKGCSQDEDGRVQGNQQSHGQGDGGEDQDEFFKIQAHEDLECPEAFHQGLVQPQMPHAGHEADHGGQQAEEGPVDLLDEGVPVQGAEDEQKTDHRKGDQGNGDFVDRGKDNARREQKDAGQGRPFPGVHGGKCFPLGPDPGLVQIQGFPPLEEESREQKIPPQNDSPGDGRGNEPIGKSKGLLVLGGKETEDHEVGRGGGKKYRGEDIDPVQAGQVEDVGGLVSGGGVHLVHDLVEDGAGDDGPGRDGGDHRIEEAAGEEYRNLVGQGVGRDGFQQPEGVAAGQTRGGDHRPQPHHRQGNEETVGGKSRQGHPGGDQIKEKQQKQRQESRDEIRREGKHPEHQGQGGDGEKDGRFHSHTSAGEVEEEAVGGHQGAEPGQGFGGNQGSGGHGVSL